MNHHWIKSNLPHIDQECSECGLGRVKVTTLPKHFYSYFVNGYFIERRPGCNKFKSKVFVTKKNQLELVF